MQFEMEVKSLSPVIQYERCVLCPCKAGVCPRRLSKTQANPDRYFYSHSKPECSIEKGFFQWEDMLKDEELIDVPFCGGCLAGRCRVRKETSGPNSGRILFTCRVKEGQGSCGYRVWQDELQMIVVPRTHSRVSSPLSTSTKLSDTNPVNLNFGEENRPSEKFQIPFVTKEVIEPPLVATSRKMKQSQGQKNEYLIATSKNDKPMISQLGKSHNESFAESKSMSELKKTDIDRCESWTNDISQENEVSSAHGKCECGLNPILVTLRNDKNPERLSWVCPRDQCNYFKREDNRDGLHHKVQSLLKRIDKLEGSIRKYRLFVTLMMVFGIILFFK